MKAKIFLAVFFFSLGVVCPSLLSAQIDYPTKPINIFIGFPSGGSVDVLTRGLTQEAKKYLGQEIILDYKPGAGGSLSWAHVIGSKADGYTLGSCLTSNFYNCPLLIDVPFDPIKETIPIIAFAKSNKMVMVKSDSPFKTLKDFLEYAKQNPGKASYGHPGIGTGNHLLMAAIAAHDGIKMNLIPFKGDSPAISALLGGHIMAAAGTIASYSAHIEAGSIRPIATYEEERLAEYPETPTIIELGYPYTSNALFFLYGPQGLSESIIKKLEDAFGKASQSPSFKKLSDSTRTRLKKIVFREELVKSFPAEKVKAIELFQKAGLGKK